MSAPLVPILVMRLSGRPGASLTSVGQVPARSWEFAEQFYFPVHDLKTDKLALILQNKAGGGEPITGASQRFLQRIRHLAEEVKNQEETPNIRYQAYEDGDEAGHTVMGQIVLDLHGKGLNLGRRKERIRLEARSNVACSLILEADLHVLEPGT